MIVPPHLPWSSSGGSLDSQPPQEIEPLSRMTGRPLWSANLPRSETAAAS